MEEPRHTEIQRRGMYNENNLPHRESRLVPYKKYSQTAHRTLRQFTNEISEILRQSIEKMDTICLKVRGCVCDMDFCPEPRRATSVNFLLNSKQDSMMSFTKSINDATKCIRDSTKSIRDPNSVHTSLKSIDFDSTKSVRTSIKSTNFTKPSKSLHDFTKILHDSDSDSNNARVEPANITLNSERTTMDSTRTPLDSTKTVLGRVQSENLRALLVSDVKSKEAEEPTQKPRPKRKTKKRVSVISFITSRKRSNIQTSSIKSVKEEQNVIGKIKQQYQDDNDSDQVQKQLRKKYVSRPRKLRKRSRSAEVYPPRPKRGAKSKKINECYTKENFDDHLWFGPKLIANEPPGRRKRVTQLARKYANENFHEKACRELPVIAENVYNGKKLKLQSDNNKDWSVMMHTHRPITRYELKQNSTLRVNRILDEITLKDLEPIKAEYPRRDHLQLPDVPLEQSLLYKLVHEDVRSLEYLVDVDSMRAAEPQLLRRIRRRGFQRTIDLQQTIPEEEPPVMEGDAKQQPKKCKRRCKKAPAAIVIEDVKADKRVVNLKEYQVYKKLARKGERRPSKYILNPTEKSYIVMPVHVEYDKDEEVRRILAPYIYGNDYGVKVGRNPTVMMMHVQPPKDKAPLRNYKFQSNKLAVGNTEQPSILIQKVVDCKQVNKQNPKHQQLISYIVNKQSQSPSHSQTEAQQKQKRFSSNSVGSVQRTHGKPETPRGKTRLKKSTGEISTLIKGIEKQVKDVSNDTSQNRKLLIGKLQSDIKTILSDMQLDNESIDCSVTSLESLKQSKISVELKRACNWSKSESNGHTSARKPSGNTPPRDPSKKRVATAEKPERKPITLAMPTEKYKKFVGYTSAKQQWVEHVAEFTKNVSLNDIVVTENPPDIHVIYPEKPPNERCLEDVERFKERFDSIMKEVDKLKQDNPNLGPVLKQTTTLDQNQSLKRNSTLNQSPDLRSPDLRSADLRSPDLRSPDLRNPDLRSPDLRSPDLRSPDLHHISVKNEKPILDFTKHAQITSQQPEKSSSSPKRYKIKPQAMQTVGFDKLSKQEQEKRSEVTKRILGKWLALENPSITEIGKPKRKVEQKIIREVKMQTVPGTADKALDALVSGPMEEKIEAFEYELGEETSKFCQELNGVMEKIQDKKWSPFQTEVKQCNFSNILDGLVTIKDSIKHCFVCHQASVRHIASEHYIKANLEQIENHEPPENMYEELLVETPENKPVKETEASANTSKSTKVQAQKVQINASEVIDRIREKLMSNSTTNYEVDIAVVETKTEPEVEDEVNLELDHINCKAYNKFLTVIYGVMFAVLFCGLNFKYSCV